jgi:glutathione S-transferase
MAEMTIVTIIMLVQFMYFSIEVGKMRQKHGVKAPAMSGHEEFERANRVQQNTLEQLIVVVPAMWMFGQYFNPLYAAGIGAIYVIARFMYRAAYMGKPSSRAIGFTTGFLAMTVLLLGALVGAVLKLI